MNSIVQQVVEALRPRADFAALRLLFELDAELPLIWGEHNQLSHVATNLVANAINYTPVGYVRVSTYRNGATGRVCLEVQYTGIGIEPDDMPHLFERFYRGKSVSQSNIPGTGLGLGIVKEIVDSHSGVIEVKSQPGEDSTFKVWLPTQAQGS